MPNGFLFFHLTSSILFAKIKGLLENLTAKIGKGKKPIRSKELRQQDDRWK